MASTKLTDLNKINSLNDVDLFYVVKDGVSYGITKSNLKSSLGLATGDASRIISGGMVWVGGLVYESQNLVYEILGQQFTIADGTQITIDPAPTTGTDKRIDLIYGDDSGVLSVEKGVEGDPPVKPTLDFLKIEITLVFLDTNATAPDGVSEIVVYREDLGEPAEWEATETSAGARINLADTSEPITGTYSIKTIAEPINNDFMEFQSSNPVVLNGSTLLSFDLKIIEDIGASFFEVYLADNNIIFAGINLVRTGGYINYNDTVTVQKVNIFLSDFNAAATFNDFNQIRIVVKTSVEDDFRFIMDNIQLNENNNSSLPVSVTGLDVSLDTTNFDNNLDNTITDVQKLADAVDDLPVSVSDDRLLTDNSVSGTFNLDYDSYEVWDLTLTGATTFTELNTKVKTLVLRVTGDFALTLPTGWDVGISGSYDGTVSNLIVVQYFGIVGEYKVQISQPD